MYTSLVRHSGNRELFLFLELAILSQSRGHPLHIHVEGLRGTGKTTIIRAARQILPPIKRIRGCLYNCDPERPHCPEHRHLSREAIASLGIEEIPMPFLEISASAKIGTVVGTIDLARITNPARPEAALLPGTIPQAHRGIVFVDEINRLADTSPELADVLLDVMGTKPGRLQIEESGLPGLSCPFRFLSGQLPTPTKIQAVWRIYGASFRTALTSWWQWAGRRNPRRWRRSWPGTGEGKRIILPGTGRCRRNCSKWLPSFPRWR